MAISLKATGAWARMVTDLGTVAIPGSPAAGDRMFLFGSWKDFSVTVADPSGWTSITAFADGTTAAGNGTGSVKVAAWFRNWVSGDANPAVDYSAAPTEGHWVIQLWQKAAGDTWAVPTFATAAVAANDPWSASASTDVTVPDSAVVFELVGLRDDSTTIGRDTNTALDDDGSPAVTWNGNIVESPATHFSSTTGLDMSGDLIHRLVTTGASGVTLTTTGDPAAAETGACLWIVQALVVTISGSGGVIFAAPANASTAKEAMIGSGGVDLDAPAIAGTGKETLSGSGGLTFLAPAVAGIGSVAGGAVTGTGAITFLAPSLSGTGIEAILGTGALAFAAPAVTGTGKEAITGQAGLTFLAPTLDGTGLVLIPVSGSGGVAIAAPAFSGMGSGGVSAVASPPRGSARVLRAAFLVTPQIRGHGAVGISGPRVSGAGNTNDDEIAIALLLGA